MCFSKNIEGVWGKCCCDFTILQIFRKFADMILKSISILNYKNIAEANMLFSPKINCFTGNNGMGKTNILDAIYYLSFCKSSMTQGGDAAVVNHDAEMMMLQGQYLRRGDVENISIGIQRGRRKAVKRNGKEYQRLSQHIGLLPIVMVSPLDWELIRGAGEERRRLMDQIISQSDREYLDALIRYAKAVENRNALIKRGFRDPILLETVEEQMCVAATFIHSVRRRWIEEFSPIFLRYYQDIAQSAEVVSVKYRSHLNEAPMRDLLAANRERDMVVGYTTHGVHRDDIELMLGDYPMRKTGSQGQCKTYTIALRLAQFDFLKQMSGITPILLLDDIFDKLDARRVENIINVVSDGGDFGFGQIFITDTNRTHLDEIIRSVGSDYRIFDVESGVCRDVESGAEGGIDKTDDEIH